MKIVMNVITTMGVVSQLSVQMGVKVVMSVMGYVKIQRVRQDVRVQITVGKEVPLVNVVVS